MAKEAFLINPPRKYRSNPLGMEEIMFLNPPKKRKKSKSKKSAVKRVVRRKRTSAKRVVRRAKASVRRVRRSATRVAKRTYRRARRVGGVALNTRSIVPTVKEGAFIALGAVGSGYITSMLPWVKDQQGVTKHIARLAVGIVGGNLIGKYANKSLGRAFAIGAVVSTVLKVVTDANLVGAQVSAIASNGLSEYYDGVGEYYTPQALSAQEDGLSFEAGLPERLDPSARF